METIWFLLGDKGKQFVLWYHVLVSSVKSAIAQKDGATLFRITTLKCDSKHVPGLTWHELETQHVNYALIRLHLSITEPDWYANRQN